MKSCSSFTSTILINCCLSVLDYNFQNFRYHILRYNMLYHVPVLYIRIRAIVQENISKYASVSPNYIIITHFYSSIIVNSHSCAKYSTKKTFLACLKMQSTSSKEKTQQRMDIVKNGVGYRLANERDTEKVVKFIMEHF